MRAPGHSALAGCAWASTCLVTRPELVPMLAGGLVAVGAGLGPDIDEPGSAISRRIGFLGQALAHVVKAISGHRGATHSILATVLITAAGYGALGSTTVAYVLTYVFAYVATFTFRISPLERLIVVGLVAVVLTASDQPPAWIGLAIGVGWASHLVGDICTPHGCPLFWPVSKRCYSFRLFRTGSTTEELLTYALWALALFMVYKALPADVAV